MKRVAACAVAVGLLVGSVAFSNPSWAAPGTLSGPSATISWDDSGWYVPTGCTQFPIQYTTTGKNLTSDVSFVGPFGDNVGSTGLYGTNTSGTALLQVCSFKLQGMKGDIPLTLRFKDGQNFTEGDGSDQVFEAPIVLKSRSGAPADGSRLITCLNKKTFKKKDFKGSRCPSGWVKI